MFFITEIILIRHGETAGNKRRNYIGRTDEPLSAAGADYLRACAAEGLYPRAELLIISPLMRCRQTAAIIYPDLQPRVIDDFRECDFGAFENLNYQDLSDNADYQAWIDGGGEGAFPGGESRAEFCRRVCRGFDAAINLAKAAKRTAMVIHGGTIMAILSSYTSGAYYDFITENGCGWRVNLDEELWRQERRLPNPQPLF